VIGGLLFDFDGLLVDTEGPRFRAWGDVYAEHGHEFELDRWIENVGTLGEPFDPAIRLAELTGLPLDREELHALRRARELELVEAEELREGVGPLLEEARARGVAVAIVSSASERWVRSHLGRLGLEEVWQTIVCANGDVARAKPAPQLYLEALQALALRADEAIAFEDSLHGVRAAKAAGIFTVAVPNLVTAGLALDEADLVVESLAGLTLDALVGLAEAA
jgi:HAD superfamily hydrolase (TIGR01509 family)